jgi:hypothetical protein
MKPQIASRAETTRAAHDTFIGTLYGPIATVHRLITLKTCMIATTAKIKAETAARSTSYLSPSTTPLPFPLLHELRERH